jgi:hypothetical protein
VAEVREVNEGVARGDMDDCRLRKFFGLREIEPSPWTRWLRPWFAAGAALRLRPSPKGAAQTESQSQCLRVVTSRRSKRFRRLSEDSEYSEAPSGTFTRWDVHQALRRTFKRPEDLDQSLEHLCRHRYLAEQTASGQVGRGHKSPVYELNRAFIRDCGR